MRIFRFDHSGSISCGFSYKEKPFIIRNFLWRLVNPRHQIPKTVVGWDESIRIPSQVQIDMMCGRIHQWSPGFQFDEADCRWVRVRLNDRGLLIASQRYGIIGSPEDEVPSVEEGPPVERSACFKESGSSHHVDTGNHHPLGLGDVYGYTFGPPFHKSSGLAPVLPLSGKYYVFVLKDSWHQRTRQPENLFYERIQERYPALTSRPEFGWVNEIYADANGEPGTIPGLADYYDRGHTTASQRVPIAERNRSRILTGPVGDNLVRFTSTRDLVIAVRDAVGISSLVVVEYCIVILALVISSWTV
ncbi:hypothetical protein BDQ17DRAFT_1364714 [Cyathus striatus]|nr:hypothetical protein BDQ17DRAFT_1364714 [Cyathus striatus]